MDFLYIFFLNKKIHQLHLNPFPHNHKIVMQLLFFPC